MAPAGGERRLPVIVVGGGPVGLSAAILLGMAGVAVAVLEQRADVDPLPRAAHLDDVSARVLQAMGVDETALSGARPLARYEFVDAQGSLLVAFDRDPAGPNGHPQSLTIHQPSLERALRDRATKIDAVDLRLGVTVEAVHPTATDVRVRVRDRAGATLTVAGSYLLGCDGAGSLVRRQLGIGLRSHRFDQRWVVIDAVAPGVSERHPHAQQVCDPRRPTSYVPMPASRVRWELRLWADEDPGDPLDASFVAAAVEPWVDRSQVTVERATVYEFHAVQARRWRQGPVLLCGDAAHQMPPFLGQGLAAGLADAHNLAWKLTLVWRRQAAPMLLDTYQSERRPQVRQLTRLAILLGWLITGRRPAARALREGTAGLLRAVPWLRQALERRADPPLPRGPGPPRRRGVGRRLPQPWLLAGEGHRVRGDELLGPGFAVVGLGVSPAALVGQPAARFLRALGARTMRVDAPGTGPFPDAARPDAGPRPRDHVRAVDHTGELTRWFAAQRARVAVVRPDRYVAALVSGRGDQPRELDEALARLAGWLSDPAAT